MVGSQLCASNGTAGWQRTVLSPILVLIFIADKNLGENSGLCGFCPQKSDFVWISELLEGPDITLRRVVL